jgi:hypothetical protein
MLIAVAERGRGGSAMLSAHVVRMLEQHANGLADEVVRDLTGNPRTPSFHARSQDELRRRAQRIYNLAVEFLATGDQRTLQVEFAGVGRQRFREGIPIEEVVYALLRTKHHLRRRLRSVSGLTSEFELHSEVELDLQLGRFFDLLLYGAVRGYEDARNEAAHPEKRHTPSRFTLEETATKHDWVL